MSLQNTMVNTRVTRPTSSLIDHQLKLVKKRSLQENTTQSQQKTYPNDAPSSYTIYKAEINYVLADSGDYHNYPNTPIVIEETSSAYNTVLVRDTDAHLNNFCKVSTLSSGPAIDPDYPTVLVFENREETIENGAFFDILYIAKTVAPI